jgi:hypothetical protein
MLSYENDELLIVKVCPKCAKAGRGRGLLVPDGFTYSRDQDDNRYKCRLCGWVGTDFMCQEYCFPCEVQRVTVMEVEVLQNLLTFACRKDEAVEIGQVTGGYYDADPTYDIKAEDCRDRLMKGLTNCNVDFALKILVARGCLLPGFYKITF